MIVYKIIYKIIIISLLILSTLVSSNETLSVREHLILLRLYYDNHGSEWKNKQGWKEYADVMLASDECVRQAFESINPKTTTIPSFMWLDVFNQLDNNKTLYDVIHTQIQGHRVVICSAYGITCESRTNLTGINLSNNNLKGDIIPFLPYLNHLKYLDLSNNNLTGCFPDGLLKAQSLVTLNLKNNSIGCSLPLADSKFLQYIDLSHNQITGYFRNVWKTPKLLRLNISFNKLYGTILKEFFKQKSLDIVDLSSNQLIGFLPILSKSKITFLNVSNNRLIGNSTYLTCWKSGSLRTFDADNNAFYGTLPDSLLDHSPLRHVYLRGNQITGPLPSILDCVRSIKVYTPRGLVQTKCHPRILSGESPIELNPVGGEFNICGMDFGINNKSISIVFENGYRCQNITIIKANSIIQCNIPRGRNGSYLNVTIGSSVMQQKIHFSEPHVASISKVFKNLGGRLTLTGKNLDSFDSKKPTIITIGSDNIVCSNPVIESSEIITCSIAANTNIKLPANISVSIDGLRAIIEKNTFFYYKEILNNDIRISKPSNYNETIIVSVANPNLIDINQVMEIMVDDRQCLQLAIINSTSIQCLPDIKTCGSALKVTLISQMDEPQYSLGLDYPPPIISRITKGIDSDSILTIFGQFLRGKKGKTKILINDTICCPLYDDSKSEMVQDDFVTCYYTPKNRTVINYNFPVTITISDQTTIKQNIYSDRDANCPDHCIKHKTVTCRDGVCECYPNLNGHSCDQNIPENSFYIDPMQPEFHLSFPLFLSNFTLNAKFSKLLELSKDGKSEIRSYENIGWSIKSISNATLIGTIYTAMIQGVEFSILVSFDTIHKEKYFAGDIAQVPKNSVEIHVTLVGKWDFKHQDNQLQFQFTFFSVDNHDYSTCLPPPLIGTFYDQNLKWITMDIDDVTMYVKPYYRTLIDSLVVPVGCELKLKNQNTSFDLLYSFSNQGITRFDKSLEFRLDFSSMMNSNEIIPKSRGCFHDNTHKFPDFYILFFSCASALVVALVICIIQCSRLESRQRKQLIKSFKSKQKNNLIEVKTPLLPPNFHFNFFDYNSQINLNDNGNNGNLSPRNNQQQQQQQQINEPQIEKEDNFCSDNGDDYDRVIPNTK